jgi:8-oxo-dGTP pyrophosphatase MutT (NUDIX family)
VSSELIPAATVVLLRHSDDGFETLMLRKNRGQAFGGHWVFPGGRVEPGDGSPGASEQKAAQHAAVREAAEETGVVLRGAELIPFGIWVPPLEAPKRFSTWFFVAALPEGAEEVVIDGGEIGDHVWEAPQAALDRHAAGEVELVPPTWITLWQLAQSDSVEGALDWARTTDIRRHATRMVNDSGVLVALWEPDAGYESGDLTIAGPRNRLRMTDGGWVYERSGPSDR